MNYQPEVLDHVFTLAHEAGHSMHSYYSARHQPYQYYNYTIFVAEVASTFNEQLLSRHLLQKAESDKERAYLINRDIDAIRGTIIRQTMFAEFEKITHETVEAGEPLTVEKFKEIYRALLDRYFGKDFVIDDELALECFRIPHFYRAFYVYKYATGLSAAIALSERSRQWRQARTKRLSRLPQRRLLQIPAGSLARRRRRHGKARPSRNRPEALRPPRRRTRRIAPSYRSGEMRRAEDGCEFLLYLISASSAASLDHGFSVVIHTSGLPASSSRTSHFSPA